MKRSLASAWIDGLESIDIEEFPSFRVARVSGMLNRQVTRAYLEESGLGLPAWRLLALLHKYSPLPLRDAREISTMDSGLASRALSRLVSDGYAESRPDEANARRTIISITPAGRKMFGRVMLRAREAQMAFLKEMTPAERITLAEAIAVLEAHLGSTIPGDVNE